MPKDARAQREEVFQSLKRELSNPALSEEHRLLMLRASAITHYWNANQARANRPATHPHHHGSLVARSLLAACLEAVSPRRSDVRGPGCQTWQVRQLVSLITYQKRVEAAVMLFRRCVDPKNYVDVVWNMLAPGWQESPTHDGLHAPLPLQLPSSG